MRDPHVQRLFYEVGSGEGLSYKEPEPIAFSNQFGAFELCDGKLSIVPTEHFAKEADARRIIDPFLRAWEVESDLNSNVGMIRFKFAQAEVVDRDPPPPGTSQVIEAKLSEMLMVSDTVSLHLTFNQYPQPPKAFRTTPEVEIGYQRWLAFRTGKEPLQSMAYSVLTLLESSAGGRKHAAQTFQICMAVLNTVGELSSTKGDGRTARKFHRETVLQELSGPETHWLEQAVRRMVHRLGEHASGAPLTKIRLSDLPNL